MDADEIDSPLYRDGQPRKGQRQGQADVESIPDQGAYETPLAC
jgi:hypothetical protein